MEPIEVVIEVVRGGHASVHVRSVAEGTQVRSVLRSIGQAAEGCAVLIGETSVPLDLPIERAVKLTVVPTFSGG